MYGPKQHTAANESNYMTMRIATFNVRGLMQNHKKVSLADDLQKYKITVACIQETHINNDGAINIKTSDNSSTYTLYHVSSPDSHHGCGIIIDRNTECAFTKINDRACSLTIHVPTTRTKKPLIIICAYAPTLDASEKNPEIRENFYNDLQSYISDAPSSSMIIIGGDFNAKTGSSHNDHPETIGEFGKGITNTNGENLLEFARSNSMVLCNTLFYHKMAHRTTWESPGNSPVRNQIDYILVKQNARKLVKNCRSYNGTTTNSDHRIVICDIELKWYKMFHKKKIKTNNFDMQRLKNGTIRQKYIDSVKERLNEEAEEKSAQEQWNIIKDACISSAETHLRKVRHKEKFISTEFQTLCEKQQKLRKDINSLKDIGKRKLLKQERNRVQKLIKDLKRKDNNRILKEQTSEIEACKNDSNRLFATMRILYRKHPSDLLIEKQGANNQLKKTVTACPRQQVQLITNHFNNVFNNQDEPGIPRVEPVKMKTPFSEEEVQSAIKSMKNNKSAGIDDVTTELIKYGPLNEISTRIASLLNHIAEHGDTPEEIHKGILVPFQKPGKPKGPCENLRPIILLSVIRKILSICMIRRTTEKLETIIPLSQAAYRSGRSTTEHVFALKMLI